MKLTPYDKRILGTCDVSRCQQDAAAIASGKTFFSKMAGDLELCENHVLKAQEMATAQGKELVWWQPGKEEEPELPTVVRGQLATTTNALVLPGDDFRDEMVAETGEAKDALEAFRAFKIATKEDLIFAAEMLAEAKGHYKRIDEKRKEITKPLNDALKATRALFKPALDFYSECETVLKREMAAAHRRSEQEKREALAEAQVAATEGDEEGVAEALTVMDKAAAFPEADGVQYRSAWKFEITDEDAIPREYCSPNLKLIAGIVAHRKGATEIAGVRVYEDTVVASKSV